MHLSSLLIGLNLLVSLENHFVTSKHFSQNIILKELLLSSYGSPISSKGPEAKRTEASHYLGATFWVLNPPMFA